MPQKQRARRRKGNPHRCFDRALNQRVESRGPPPARNGNNAHDHRVVFHTVTYRCFRKPSFFPYAQRALFPVKVLLETGRNRGPRRGESDAGQTRFLSESVQWNTRLGV